MPGMRLSALASALAGAGQRFSLDPPGDPTLGECLLENLSGPLSHRFGTMRDLVIGVTVVLPDGTRASSGGKVVKNVAGYDLAKVFCGSRGRLGSVERLALRLHPLPAASRTAVVAADWPALHRSQLVPSAVDIADGRMHVLFEGSQRAVDEQVRALGGEEGDPWEELRRLQATLAGRVRWDGQRRAARAAGATRRLRRGGARGAVEPARGTRRGGAVQQELIDDCVHCGFCLPTCPTYALWHEEMDSPRGRIQLMQGLVDGTIPLTDTVVEHFDRCLGCMACLTSCPSGVQYDRLIETTRSHVEEHHRRGPLDRLVRGAVFAVFPHRRRLRAALAPAQAARTRAARAAAGDRAAVARAGVAAGAAPERRAERRNRRRLRRKRHLRRRQCRNRARARTQRATTCTFRAKQGAAAPCTRTPAGSTRASRVRGSSKTRSPATTSSSRTRPGAARI